MYFLLDIIQIDEMSCHEFYQECEETDDYQWYLFELSVLCVLFQRFSLFLIQYHAQAFFSAYHHEMLFASWFFKRT